MPELQVNVAQLLKELVGATRAVDLGGPLLDTDGMPLGMTTGALTLTRTDRGLWALGDATIGVADHCSRCLKPIEFAIQVRVDDEYLPAVDVLSGARLRYHDAGDADTVSIDNHHELDLTETLREYRQAGLPLAPLCREDCKGICPRCGADVNETTHDCELERDPRWEKLRELLR